VAIFVGTHENKVDQKGRVSVPAAFRTALAGQPFQGIVVFPSLRADAIEGCGWDFMEQLDARVQDVALFSPAHNDLAATIFGVSHQLAFDSTGRIQLPEVLRVKAGITDKAAFFGMGKLFQIWEPSKLAVHLDGALQRAREQGLTLPAPGRMPDGGGR
jgi:MraZ protein